MEDLQAKKLTYRITTGLFFFLIGTVFAAWASRIHDIKEHLNLNDAMLGTALLGLPIGQFLAMGISGYLVGRYSSKKILSIGILLYPLGVLTISFANNYYQFILALIFMGMCGNSCNISANTQAVGVEKLYGKSIMAAFHGVWSLAGFIGGLIGFLIIKLGISVFEHFLLTFIFVAIASILARKYMLPRDTKIEIKKTKRFNLPDSYLVILGFTAFSSMACEGTMFDWSGIYFKTIVNAPLEFIPVGFTCFMCLMAVGRFCGDYFINKFGHTNVMKISGIFIFIGLILSTIFPTVIMAGIGFGLVGLGVSSIVPLCYSLAGRSHRMGTGNAIASVSTIGFLGFLLGPPIIGIIAQAYNLKYSFVIIAIVGLLMTGLAPILSRKLKS